MKLLLAGLASLTMQGPPLDNSARIEAERPRIAPRTLSGTEAKAMREAIARPGTGEARLVALKPYAEAGNLDAMRAMVVGYARLRDLSRGNTPSLIDRPVDRYTPLAALWGVKLAQHLKKPAKNDRILLYNAIEPCLSQASFQLKGDAVITRAGTRKTYDCGFDTVTSDDAFQRYSNYDARTVGVALPQFIERPVKPQRELDRSRMARVMRELRGLQALPAPEYVSEDQLEPMDQAWAREYAHNNDAVFAEWVDADFARAVRYARDGKLLTPGSSTWLYMKADPKREKSYAYMLSLHVSSVAWNRQDFLDQIDGATSADRKRLHDLAVREGGEFAEKWYRKFGSSLLTGELSVFGWCNIGAQSACRPAVQEAQRLDYVRQHGTPAEVSASGYVAPDLEGQLLAFKKRSAEINRGNCARASMGASITCNP